MPTARIISPSFLSFSLIMLKMVRPFTAKKEQWNIVLVVLYYKISCNESISMMFFIIRKATHVCKFIIMIKSILPKLDMKLPFQNISYFHIKIEYMHYTKSVCITTDIPKMGVSFYYLKYIKNRINLYFYDIWFCLTLGAELHMLVGTYLISLMQSIKDESKKTKDINSLLRNNRRNQRRSKRKNNFHTIA